MRTVSWKLAYTRLLGQLRQGRMKAGLSQSDIADRLVIGRRTFQRWEASECVPNAIQLFRWADVVGVSINSELKADAPNLAQ